MKLFDIINEKFVKGVEAKISFSRTKYIEIYKNPTSADFRAISKSSEYKMKRALWDGKNVYAFDAELLHHDAIRELGIKKDALHLVLFQDEKTVQILGHKGDSAWKLAMQIKEIPSLGDFTKFLDGDGNKIVL
jgi:hypothetical protein